MLRSLNVKQAVDLFFDLEEQQDESCISPSEWRVILTMKLWIRHLCLTTRGESNLLCNNICQ